MVSSCVFFFKQKTAYEMRISDWSSDVCSSDLTLAIDPATGKMKWWFQHSPGDPLDMDDVFERVLVDDDGKKLLFTIGKTGILWKLDRASGKYLDHVEADRKSVGEGKSV